MCPKLWRSTVYVAIITCAAFGQVSCPEPRASCVTPDGQPGSCIATTSCTFVRDLIDKAPKPLNTENMQLILNYRCDANSKRPKVCCPAQTGPPSVTGHRNLGLLPSECGQIEEDEEDKLYGGNETDILEFPFMALISYDYKSGERKFACAGSVINNRYILTAAHCLANLKGIVPAGVRVGEHDYATVEDCRLSDANTRECAPPVQDFFIQKVIIHAGFAAGNVQGSFRLRHDIGLIRLETPIDLTKSNAKPVCLPTTRELQEVELDNEYLVLPGWGLTETNKPSTRLLKINVPIVSNQICGQKYNRSIADGIGFRQICAGGKKNVSSCNADSGGPLVLPRFINDVSKTVQFGILSGGTDTCGLENFPGVYTRVAYYMDWILDYLEP